ncbi:MAG: pyrroloquinoline quinone-dependent dehydrogenase [Bauldia sp.]
MRMIGGIAAALLASAGAAFAQAGPTQDELNAAATNTRDWLYATHDYSGQRHVRTDLINTENAAELRPVCMLQLAVVDTFQTNPIVYDGMMYVSTPNLVVALDAVTCAEEWRQEWEGERGGIASQRGLALKDGILVRGTPDGHLLALDAADGDLLWEVDAVDPDSTDSVNVAPVIFEDMVIVGPAGTVNGWVGAFSLTDGSPIWRFNTMPQPGEFGRDTWGDHEGLTTGAIGGGSVWTIMSLDHEAGVLYVPVGNANPAFYGGDRPGDNLYTNSLLAIDVRTGELLWYYQMVPHDVHNWDTSQAGPLFTAMIGGVERNLVAATGKSGILHIVDRGTQEVLSRTPVTTQENAGLPLTREGIHMCPGYLGGVQWNGPSWNPDTGLLYVPSIDWCSVFFEDPAVGRGGGYEMDEDWRGWVTAVDPTDGSVRWAYEAAAPMVASVTTTSGGLVLAGALDGNFLVLDAADGAELYRFQTGGALAGGIVTYEIDGRQYIAVMSGSESGLWGSHGSPTVIVFSVP